MANFLVHLFGRNNETNVAYLSVVHDRCLYCEEPISDSPSYLNYRVCPFCRFHYTVTARERIDLLADRGRSKSPTSTSARLPPFRFPAAAVTGSCSPGTRTGPA